MRRVYYRYSLRDGVRKYPTKLWLASRTIPRSLAFATLAALVAVVSLHAPLGNTKPVDAFTSVPGQSYNICDDTAQYLTSPWTYHALASGDQTYTVAQYEALPGYGTTLPPLPSYIAGEDPATMAAVIFAPGSQTAQPAYAFPELPLMHFFEGGAYNDIGFDTMSGDEFIGGSAPGFPEPQFNDGGNAEGINGQNGSHYYSGGDSTLASTANVGDTTITTTSAIPGYINYITFADGSTYSIASTAGTSITLDSALTASQSASSPVWANQDYPLAYVTTGAAQGASSLTLTSASMPFVQYGEISVGDDAYNLTSVSGSQSGYTIGVGSLDSAVVAHTPIYYADNSGDVTVSYLDIDNDQHITTGTIYTGTGWTITHNNIHDGYSNGPGYGVALYGGDEGTFEYNCLSKMGDYGVNIFGSNNKFDYNEVYESNYQPDPGCGCSGGGKWWGTLNADILDNAFVNESPGDGLPIWLDNGNSGTLISGNYFDKTYGSAVHSETGFDLDVTNNLFLDNGWGDGVGGCGDNCLGAVNINQSGGFNVPGSRYENQIIVSGNQFINDWSGVSIWEAGGRTCEDSGEGWPDDAGYCSGGYPNSATTAAGGQYYFSHIGDSLHGFTTTVAQAASSGSSTLSVVGSLATDDQIGFADPLQTTTNSTTDVTTLNGSQTINAASTTSFPSTGQLRVGTSAAWSDGDGSWTGAILSYTGKTSSTFTGVSLVRGTGTLSGPILQVQPYKVTGETCYANDCKVSITPSLNSSVNAGDTVTNAGTCQLFATSTALPTGPLAPNGMSYWDGCQWESRGISVTGNNFLLQPSLMDVGTPINGGTVQCTAANSCGVNFMADQYNSGEAPFVTQIGVNAMMSQSGLTGCPAWDSGCTSNPLTNLNALSSPPGAPAGNGETPYNNVWSDNTYEGPWSWNTYIFGNCAGGGVFMPSDPTTGHSLDSSSCFDDFSHWQSNWEQDQGSTYTPVAVTINNLTDSQTIHGASQPVTAYEDTVQGSTISSSNLLVGTTTDSTVTPPSGSPHTFTLNTLSYHDGQYNIKVSATDSSSKTGSDTVPVIIDNGDLNGDGKVNISDLAIMASHWGQTDANYSDGNITGQSTIGISDLAVMATNWQWVQ